MILDIENGTVKDSKTKKVGEHQEYDIGMILPNKKRYWYDYILRIDILTQFHQKHKDYDVRNIFDC
jgi:hypothetical protein